MLDNTRRTDGPSFFRKQRWLTGNAKPILIIKLGRTQPLFFISRKDETISRQPSIDVMGDPQGSNQSTIESTDGKFANDDAREVSHSYVIWCHVQVMAYTYTRTVSYACICLSLPCLKKRYAFPAIKETQIQWLQIRFWIKMHWISTNFGLKEFHWFKLNLVNIKLSIIKQWEKTKIFATYIKICKLHLTNSYKLVSTYLQAAVIYSLW